ncbi:hypothetical protein R0K30_20235 [Bacillus sp. SIMBA_154]|uniref:hypothetical protein n=1 Tax=Bacillus sp. SIMBA_154 TaxID=3080859 RepID=UPI00397E6951
MKKLLITLTIIVAAVLFAPSAAAVTSGYKTVAGHTISVSTDANSYKPKPEALMSQHVKQEVKRSITASRYKKR